MALVHSLTPAERKEKKIVLKIPHFWLMSLSHHIPLYPGSFLYGLTPGGYFIVCSSKQAIKNPRIMKILQWGGGGGPKVLAKKHKDPKVIEGRW
jgi:hypothetical protein